MASNDELVSGGGEEDLLSSLPEGILEHVLSFLPTADAVRASVLSRRWRDAWTPAPALNLSDDPPHQTGHRFVAFADAAISRYGTPDDIPALNVTIGSISNLGPPTTAWLRDAMERVDGSISVSVTAFKPLDPLSLPCSLRAKSISLTLSVSGVGHYGRLVPPDPATSAAFGGLVELSLTRLGLQRSPRPLGEFLSSCCPGLRKLRLCQVSGGAVRSTGLWCSTCNSSRSFISSASRNVASCRWCPLI